MWGPGVWNCPTCYWSICYAAAQGSSTVNQEAQNKEICECGVKVTEMLHCFVTTTAQWTQHRKLRGDSTTSLTMYCYTCNCGHPGRMLQYLQARDWISLTGAQTVEQVSPCKVRSKACYKSAQQRGITSVPFVEPGADGVCFLPKAWLLYTLLHCLGNSCMICSTDALLNM